MLFNFGRFGRLASALVKSLFNNANSDDQLIPTPPAEYLRVVNVGSGDEYRIIDDGDYRSVET